MTRTTKRGELDGASEQDLRGEMLLKLASSGLDQEDAELMRVQPMTRAGARRLGLPSITEGFYIPYFSLEGEELDFYRVRYLRSTLKGFDKLTGKKPLKYVQPKNSSSELYLPPLGADWCAIAEDVATPLLITEGELKAACATKNGYPCIGLGGVWSFMSKREGKGLIDGFQQFSWEGRTVFIVFDSDAVTNADVLLAEQRLSTQLLQLGATVAICRLPGHDQLKKCGLDDYIVLNGVDKFADLLANKSSTYNFEASAALHAMNAEVVYIRAQRCIWSYQDRSKMSVAEFRDHRYANRSFNQLIVNKDKSTTLKPVQTAAAWVQWGARAEVAAMDFRPGEPSITADGNLNTWTGWGVTSPIAGDITPWHDLMKHLFSGHGAAEARKWFEDWCAYPLQNPGAKMATAAALWGVVHGSGKTLVGHTLMRIYGRAHSRELKDSDLDDPRNDLMENCQFALADDITARGDRRFMRRLMTMITQKFITVDPKYINKYTIPDVINYYFTSNDPDALYMDSEDRRFFVWEVLAGKYLDYKRFVAWRDSDEGIAALWHYFLERDISGFDPQAPAPLTAGKENMVLIGKSELGAWVHEFKTNMDHILARADMKGDLFSAKELHMLFDPAGDKRASENALARELRRAGFTPPATGSKIRKSDGSMVMVYAVRNIEKWKHAAWSEACRHYNEHRPADLKAKKF